MTKIEHLIAELRRYTQEQQEALERGDLSGLAQAIEAFDRLMASVDLSSEDVAALAPELREQVAELHKAHQRLVINARLYLSELNQEIRKLDRRQKAVEGYTALGTREKSGEAR